jgi:acyl-coenzyme A thioesterase PaaI-like protein
MLKTHKNIDSRYSGKVVKLSKNYAKVVLHTNIDMVADESGLIHGGFTFSAADFCAMATINEPNVVLIGANVSFLAPIKLGEVVTFEGRLISQKDAKSTVEIVASVDRKIVFKGEFKTYVTKFHILER